MNAVSKPQGIFKNINIASLSRETGIPESTLRSWKAYPDRITVAGFRRIARALELEDTQIIRIIRGRK